MEFMSDATTGAVHYRLGQRELEACRHRKCSRHLLASSHSQASTGIWPQPVLEASRHSQRVHRQ
jgi:hypothetical protein